MKILITGAAGYIGSALANRLRNHDLILVDNYSAIADGRPKLLNVDKHEIIHADICEQGVCEDIVKGVDIIYHFAACSGIGKCEHPDSYDSNLIGTVLLGKEAEKNGVKKIIFASTSAVYGESQAYQITENHRIKPRSRYGWQKYLCELMLQSLKIPAVIFRKSNVYGHGLYHKKTVVDIFIDNAYDGKNLSISGGGSQRRDYVHIDDVVEAYTKAMFWDSGVYNIGGNDNYSVDELADLVIAGSGKPINKIYDKGADPGTMLKRFEYRWDKARGMGYEPKETVQEEIKRRLGIYSNAS